MQPIDRKLFVSRYCVSGFGDRPGSECLRVGGVDLGAFRDIVEAEYRRAAEAHPENPAFHMRQMWFTGSPFGAEILELASKVRWIAKTGDSNE